MTIIIFWISLALLFYCYAGYGISLFLFNSIKSIFSKKRFNENETEIIPVTLIVAMYNEAAILERKIQNTLAIDYPKEQLRVIFVDDGSSDDSSGVVAKYPFIKLIQHSNRKGKAAAIKTAMQQVQTPIVIFSDANSMLNEQCILKMMRHYSNPIVGGVAGEKRVSNRGSGSAVGEAEGIYWQYESFLKKQDADFYTTVGAAGELFSIRTSLFQLDNDNTITDDFLISMQACLQGYRVAYEPEAYSTETASVSIQEEAKRKIRIAAGAYQSIGYLKGAFNFFKYPLLSFQYFSHRVLRWVFCPFLLPLLLISNIVIVGAMSNNLYQFFLYMQILFYLMAAIGWLLLRTGRKTGITTIPFYFIFMNVCLVKGLFVFLNGQHTVIWQKSLRTETSGIPE
jgi:cellulose synthase/poly-beta-1,6-N-acetylglucosamine synthase-like glycosyltransferase